MNDTPKQSWWQRLSGGLKRTSTTIGTAISDLVSKRRLDDATLEVRITPLDKKDTIYGYQEPIPPDAGAPL